MDGKGGALWAVLILEHDGARHFLHEAGHRGVAVYHSMRHAGEVAEFMRDRLGDEVQNVSVARYYGQMRPESLDAIRTTAWSRSHD